MMKKVIDEVLRVYATADFTELCRGIRLAMNMCDCEWAEDSFHKILSEVLWVRAGKSFDILFE